MVELDELLKEFEFQHQITPKKYQKVCTKLFKVLLKPRLEEYQTWVRDKKPIKDNWISYAKNIRDFRKLKTKYPKHQKILSTLKDKTDKWASKLTIKIWSKVDPLKRITAKKNKIPFVEWFSLEEFDAWYDLQRSNKNLKVKHEIC